MALISQTGGGDSNDPVARARVIRGQLDYLLEELAALGIHDAAHLIDAATAAIDEWLDQQNATTA